MGDQTCVIARQEAMKVASLGFLALVVLAAVTDASTMVFEDDSVDPTEESSFYENHEVAHKIEEAPQRHHAAAERAPRSAAPHPLAHRHQKKKVAKAHAKAPRKHAMAKPAAPTRHHAHHLSHHDEMEMEEDEKEDTAREEEQDYTPVVDEDDEDLHMKGQAMVESFDDDSIEDNLDEVDDDEDTDVRSDMAHAAASTKPHHDWTPKPIKDKHTSDVLNKIRAMRTKPRGQATVLTEKKLGAPAQINALQEPKKKKAPKKHSNFRVGDDEPSSFGKVKATGFFADHSWMVGAGKSYGGYRKTGKQASRREKRAASEIADFPLSDNSRSSAASRYSYANVKRAAAGKEPTVFAQELHDGASRVGAILKPKFRSMRGKYRGAGTGEDDINRKNKKAHQELRELFALGKK